MDAQIESHQPLITPRIIFTTKAFPPPPIITARMEFPPFSIPQHHEWSTTPVAPEEHPSTPKRHTTPKRTSTPNRHTTPKHTSTSKRHATPQQNAASTGKQRPQGTSVVFMNVDSDASQIENGDFGSPLSSLSDDERNELESEDKEVNTKIPKLPGEAGRPHSGGYNLQDKLGWNDRTYESIIALVHKMAKDKLNITKSFCAQDMKRIKEICNVVCKEYAILKDYEEDWPTHDVLKLHLKYTSEVSRRSLTVSMVKNIEKIATQAMSKAV